MSVYLGVMKEGNDVDCFNRNGKGNSWRGDWQGEFLKGRVRRTLLFFFLVMYLAIPFFGKICNVFVTTSSYAFWFKAC